MHGVRGLVCEKGGWGILQCKKPLNPPPPWLFRHCRHLIFEKLLLPCNHLNTNTFWNQNVSTTTNDNNVHPAQPAGNFAAPSKKKQITNSMSHFNYSCQQHFGSGWYSVSKKHPWLLQTLHSIS